MTVVLDSGGVSALAVDRRLIDLLRRQGQWPPEVPSVVLTECLSGDHRRDHATNRLLSMCTIRPVDEPLARRAAALRAGTGRAGEISVVDAIVAARAEGVEESTILTGDEPDIRALVAQSERGIRVLAV